MPACLINARMSAISNSRPSGGPSPCATASGADQPDRQIGADHLPRRARARQARASAIPPAAGPRKWQSGPNATSLSMIVRSAVAPHVEHEQIEQRSIGHLAIDAAGLGGRLPHRHVFVEGAPPARGQQATALVVVISPQRTSPGHQSLATSWSSHCAMIGTSALKRQQVARRADCICSCRESRRAFARLATSLR